MYSWSKNNSEQRDKPKGLPCVTGCKGAIKQGIDGKWVEPSVLCPVHIGWHAKVLQARDACVAVAELKAPVFSKVVVPEKVPAGATLVVDEDERAAVAAKVGKLVLVITREQEQRGLIYDGSVPFVLNDRKFRPSPRGVWFMVKGQGYAVFAWAKAESVTHRIRKMMYAVNARSEEEVVPVTTITKLSSRSLRIAMATLLTHRGVPIEEVVENGEWEDAAMAKTYIRSLDPLAVQRRNLSDVVFPVGEGGGTMLSALARVGTGTLQTARSEVECVAVAMEQEGDLASVEPMAPPTTEAGKRERSANQPCCPHLWVKGKVFKRENVAGNAQLQRLLEGTVGKKPAHVQKVLCGASFHVTRKEISNYRERMALQAMEAPEVEPEELLLAIAE